MIPQWLKPWLLIFVTLFGVAYCAHHWTVQRRIANTGVVAEEPVQKSTDALPIERDGYQIEFVASYDIRAKVLSIERYRFGRDADFSPVDFALGWGPMSDHKVIEQLNISQSYRWYHYGWKNTPPIDPAIMIRSSANTHLVPADSGIKDRLLKVRTGEIVRLKGYLINIRHPDGWTWRSSLTRGDSGGGSCELMWVTDARVE